MKFLNIPLVLLLLLLPPTLRANHIFGGELYYTHISVNTYKITLTLYGDCGTNNQSAFDSLPTSNPMILINNGNNPAATLQLFPLSVGDDITPVCPQQAHNTKCANDSATLPGIKRFVYENVYTMPFPSSQWNFVFEGTLGNNIAGRSSNITNIITPGTLYLTATLNNLAGGNSSPQFTTTPTPFYCINIQQEYNQGVVDADNDSLVFDLVPALSAGVPVNYASSLSGAYPLSTQNGMFNFNHLNGQMSFTPDILQNGVVVNMVSEYKNGVLVGSTTREMTFIVLDNCQNIPPAGSIDSASVAGGMLTPDNIINICEGTPSVSFSYTVQDADGDTVSVTHTPLPAGASLQVLDNNTTHPTFSFNWNTSAVPAGVYNFFVRLKDRHCPLSSQQTFGFTIRIVKANALIAEVTAPTNCFHKATVAFSFLNGLLPRQIQISKNGVPVKTFTDSTGSYMDSLDAGTYLVHVSSPGLSCSTDYTFTIEHAGIFPLSPLVEDALICIGDETKPIDAIPWPGATINWYDISGNPLPGAPVPNSNEPGRYPWIVNQQYINCPSRKDTVEITVADKPEVVITNKEEVHCVGDKVYLQATGVEHYAWQPEEELFYAPDSSLFIRLYQPSVFTVVGTNTYGCKDTSSISFNNILPCCNFSYPNVFSPNNDGQNDSWHPLMYGNHEYYELSVYNRWGQRVFHSFIPNAGWDGTLQGVVQPVGTYFYYLRAKCVTGREEEQKGDVYLIR